MNSRGQVSIFVILGFVILIAASTIFYFNDEEIERVIETEIPGDIEFTGQGELRSFMDACIRDAAFNGLEILRLQSGFIYIPDGIETVTVNDGSSIVTRDGIDKVVEGGNHKAVYWLDSNNNLNVPTIEYIENSLSTYVEDSIEVCVNNFDAFRNQNYVVTAKFPTVTVSLSEEVLFDVNYPMTFQKGDILFEEEEFILRVPLNLKKAIEVQSEIVEAEYIANFLESDVKSLLSLYSYAGGEDGLPPLSFTNSNLDCSIETWTIQEVSDSLKNNFAANLVYVQANGYTESEPENVYKGFSHNIVPPGYDNIGIDFSFDSSQDFYLDIKPRVGNLIKPDIFRTTGIKLLPMICNIDYEFKYTMQFPVFSSVTDGNSRDLNLVGRTMGQDDFVFTIPIGLFLCGNQERECTGPPAYATADYTLDSDYFEFDIPTKTMFCDPGMRKSATYRISAADGQNFAPDLNILYTCGSAADDCLIGTTDENGILETQLPLCVNGHLHVMDPDYGPSWQLLTTQIGDEIRDLDYEVEEIKELEVEVQVIDLEVFMTNFYLTNGYIDSSCVGEPSIENAATGPDNFNIIISAVSGPTPSLTVFPANNEILLSSGDYTFSTLVEGEAFIPTQIYEGESISMNKNGGDYRGTYLFGSYDDMQISFTKEELSAASKIIFYAPVESTKTTVDLLDLNYIIQPDGSLNLEGPIDIDCDGATDEIANIVVTKDMVSELLKPRLI